MHYTFSTEQGRWNSGGTGTGPGPGGHSPLTFHEVLIYTPHFFCQQGSYTFVKTNFKDSQGHKHRFSKALKILNPILKPANLLLFCNLINGDKHHQIIDSYQALWFWTRGPKLLCIDWQKIALLKLICTLRAFNKKV